MNDEIKKLKDKVWFTYKSRIRAEERLLSNDFHSQLILVWYALVNVGYSVVIIQYPSFFGSNTNIVMALFGVGILSLSLIMQNRNFKERADGLKYNYLELNKLQNTENIGLEQLNDKYNDILEQVENHKQIDYKYFRVFENGLTSNLPSCFEKIQVWFYIVFRYLFLSIIYILPLLGIYYLYSSTYSF